tara:strand:- start:633 stop:3116 length:2484 start_codon:yes stop_codon:yes gene_type:complete
VGEVARELLARIPPDVRRTLYPDGAELVAACHDVGKVSPTFAKKLLSNTHSWSPVAFPMLADINASLETQWGGHPGVSQVAVEALQPGDYIAQIVGQHHGFKPSISGYRADAEVFGGIAWQQQREALVAQLKLALGCDWPVIKNFTQARSIAGLTTVADWIGSGSFFEEPNKEGWLPNISRALDSAGFVPAKVKAALTFNDVFGFTPRPAQQRLIDAVGGPGVYILEAPMGMGKTEAALYAAYQQIAQGNASGIYFALPTQLTSNKIYDRFNKFLEVVLDAECPHRSLLLHANAWMVATEMGEEGAPGNAWFNASKRGLLAPFAVGTLDQALMAVMNVRHGFVRTFGLAGKVVILDEIHTYDAYTGTLLDALVEGLRELHCTVIILSATLNAERRQELLQVDSLSNAYPLISAQSSTDRTETWGVQELSVPVEAGPIVQILWADNERMALEAALTRAEQGQQVLWIENTVNEAQQCYLNLAARCAELDIDCGLLHSRFTAAQRQVNEAFWVEQFGRPGWPSRNERGRILIGTQVLEQSLDIDADFLVSRFAPTDMLLQRIGRLWRHTDAPRHSEASCTALFIAPALEVAVRHPPTAFGASAWVYSPYVLCRSLEVWQTLTTITLPKNIRPLIDQTYAVRPEDGEMARWLHELDQGTSRPKRTGRQALRQFARITLAQHGNTLPESKAETRYSDGESVDLLLLRNLRLDPEQQISHLTLLDGQLLSLPWQRHRLNKEEWRRLSALLSQQLLHIRIEQAPLPVNRQSLARTGLQHCFYLGDPAFDEALLRVAIVDETAALHGYQGAPVNDRYQLTYRADLGYRADKIKE